jgi:hypothetical protein
MDGSRFEAWTRRRFGLAGGLIAALLTLDPARDGVSKQKRRHKHHKRHKRTGKCGTQEKECQGTCIPRSQCCGDCPSGTYCCEGECVSLETCCGSGVCPSGCPCRRNVEGEQFCTTADFPVCAQCTSSDGCLADEGCFPASCGDGVTAVCRTICKFEK